MAKFEERSFLKYPHPYVTIAELETLLEGSPNSRHSKVKRWLAQGKLLHIRRGLYCLTEELGYFKKPHPYELAQYIYGPSYISLESALSFYNLIPEAVYTVTCVTSKRSIEFETPLGKFIYEHLPSENLYADVEIIKEGEYQFFMAKPWKAICDYIFLYKKNWHSLEPLLKNLRINQDNLPSLRSEEIQLLDDYYRHKRISNFLKGIQKNLAIV